MTVTADNPEVVALERDMLRFALGVIRDYAAVGLSVAPLDAPTRAPLHLIRAQAINSLTDAANQALHSIDGAAR